MTIRRRDFLKLSSAAALTSGLPRLARGAVGRYKSRKFFFCHFELLLGRVDLTACPPRE